MHFVIGVALHHTHLAKLPRQVTYNFDLQLQVDKTCNYRPEQRDNMDDLIDSMMKNFTRAIESRGLNQETIDLALKLILVNREMTFVKCWFKQKEMNCDKLVLNSIISTINYLVPSFTVNLASNLVEAFRNKNVLGMKLITFFNQRLRVSYFRVFAPK